MGQEPDEIRREIEATRGRMTETVGAIGYKADVPARARESARNARNKVSGKVRGARERVVESIVGTKRSMGESMGNAGDRINEATPSADELRRGVRRTAGLAQENPAGLAVGAVAVGFLAGLMVPTTRAERERLGPIATEVKEKARETGQEAAERGKEVMDQATDAAKQVVQQTKETAQQAAQEQAENVTETARQEGQAVASSAREKTQEVASTDTSDMHDTPGSKDRPNL
jgi:vacuolar-type H+-ATPase subunit H